MGLVVKGYREIDIRKVELVYGDCYYFNNFPELGLMKFDKRAIINYNNIRLVKETSWNLTFYRPISKKKKIG